MSNKGEEIQAFFTTLADLSTEGGRKVGEFLRDSGVDAQTARVYFTGMYAHFKYGILDVLQQEERDDPDPS